MHKHIDGYANVDSTRGGVFLSAVCEVFRNEKFIDNHSWAQIVKRIRSKTRKRSTINNEFLKSTQLPQFTETLDTDLHFVRNNVK